MACARIAGRLNKKGVTALYIPLTGMKKHLGGLTMKLDREKLMTLLVHNTPSGNETLTRDFVLEELKRLGFTAQTDDYGKSAEINIRIIYNFF